MGKTNPFMTREQEKQETKPAERIRCRCERCGKVIYVKSGYEKLCILCIAERKGV